MGGCCTLMCESLLSAAHIQPHNAQHGARDAAFHLRTESKTDFNNSLGVKLMWQSKKCLKNVWSVCILLSCSCFIIHSSRQYSDYYTQLYTLYSLYSSGSPSLDFHRISRLRERTEPKVVSWVRSYTEKVRLSPSTTAWLSREVAGLSSNCSPCKIKTGLFQS